MKTCDMAVGNPIYFEGKESLHSIFGFVFVKVKTPNLHKPILPFRSSQNSTLLFPVGN